jgi:hypothetical protein
MADEPAEKPAEQKPAGRTRTTARPRESRSVSSRLERRAAKVKETLREAIRWRRSDAGEGDLGFVATLERDADGVGHAVAAIGEHLKPFGLLIDTLFGEAGPLSIFVALAPSIRAGRREAVERLRERRQRRLDEQAERERAGDEPVVIGAQPNNPAWPGDSDSLVA